MHLVFLNQYYPPDAAPTGVMLEAVVERLAEQGHEVTVICAEGGYAEGGTSNIERRTSNIELPTSNVEGRGNETPESRAQSQDSSQPSTINSQPSTNPIHLLRVPATRFGRGSAVGKLADYATFYLAVAWKLATLPRRPDRVIALTTPPYLSVLARLVSKLRGADHAHWVMDLYPDVMVAHGMLAEGGWKHRLLAGFARWGFGGGRCAAILTLGPDMAERLTNIERRTSNIERRNKENGSGGPASVGGYPDHQPSTIDYQLSPVQWVPLWGGDVGRVVGGPLSVVGCRDASAAVASASASSSEPLHYQPSTLNHQLSPNSQPSPLDSPPVTSALGGQVGGPGGPAIPSSDHQPSTINYQPSSPLRAKRGWAENELVVMYSGNMGLGHRFDEFLEAAERMARGEVISDQSSVIREETSESGPQATPGIHSASASELLPLHHQPSTLNSQPSPNIEIRSAEACSGASATVADVPDSIQNHQSSIINRQFSNPQPSTLNSQPSPPIRFVFYGGGKRRKEIETFMLAHPECRIELHDYAPAEELTEHLLSADVHLASLDAAWTGTMVPSKLQGIFAVGRPVIFVGSPESSIGRWVAESGGGWVVEPGDVDGLLAALDEAGDTAVRMTRGNAAGEFAKRYFDKGTNAARVAEILSR